MYSVIIILWGFPYRNCTESWKSCSKYLEYIWIY